ncbi:DUF3987 domain-containing protein [Microbulbifer mangrovi]|uniref:DUF3987 domain-containing protein n=1 Tax=Microbulbifer mangrovi TaxID=927787 RepID=UPI00117C05F0|nr:DUF3987 domain-containing protein [Microbulbifer mangrovi]
MNPEQPTPKKMSSLVSSALEYAAQGFPVLPLHSISEEGHCTCTENPCRNKPGKHPRTKNGLHNATIDPEKIKRWWSMWPNANIGLLPNALVVDVDNQEAFSKLLEKHGTTMPHCPTVRTGKGFHLYFANPEAGKVKSTGGIAGCFDVRGNTSYAVAPPSMHISGKVYEWLIPLTGTLPQAPQWLLREIADHKAKGGKLPNNNAPTVSSNGIAPTRTSRYGHAALDSAYQRVRVTKEGSRNNSLNEEAYCIGQLIGGGEIDESEAMNVLRAAAISTGLDDDEVNRTLKSAFAAGIQKPRTAEGDASSFIQSAAPEIAKVATIAVAKPEWPDPQPIVGIHKIEPYPEDALPPTIQAAVKEVASFTQAPLPLVASTALGAVSIATQHLSDVKRDEKLKGPTSLFLLTIADSGERKSTCEGYFTRPIAEYEKEQAEVMASEIKRHKSEHAAWEAKRSGLLAAIKKGAEQEPESVIRKKEAELTELELREPHSPKVPKLLLGDHTPESLGRTLAKKYPSGGISSSEGGIIFGSHGMGSESVMRNLATLNVLWDGGMLDVGRVGSGDLTIDGVRLTVSLQVQKETLETFIERVGALARGSGYWARFLFAWPQSTQGTRLYKEPPKNTPALEVFSRRVREILDSPAPLTRKGTLEPPALSFTPEAKALWVEFYNGIEKELGEGGGLESVRDAASKAADNAARLSALFHIFENGGTGAIGIDSVNGACRLAAWHLNETLRFFNEVDLPQVLKDAATLEKWVVDKCKKYGDRKIPKNEVAQKGPYSIRKKAKLDPAIRALELLGRFKLENDGRRDVLCINPALMSATDAS